MRNLQVFVLSCDEETWIKDRSNFVDAICSTAAPTLRVLRMHWITEDLYQWPVDFRGFGTWSY